VLTVFPAGKVFSDPTIAWENGETRENFVTVVLDAHDLILTKRGPWT